MTGYKMNFATKTLTITKAFAAKAMLPNTQEANIILNMRTLIPDLKISYKTHAGSRPHPFKGLSFRKMEDYIRCCENESELMTVYRGIREIAMVQPNPHNYVCRWFMRQFPDYKEIPTLNNGRIAAVKPITLEKEWIHTSNEATEAAAA